jgi:hypothetical protein
MLHDEHSHVAEFVHALSTEMPAFCGPIFITPGLKTLPDAMIDNGTYSLIDTGKRRILVTCYHVWRAFLESKAKNPDTVLGIDLGEGHGIEFAAPERQIIDGDDELDLVVFEFEPRHLSVNGIPISHRKEWFPVQCWPIPKASEGGYVALMGFPGKRIVKDGMLCTFRTQVIPFKVSGVGLKEIYLLNEPENAEVFRDTKTFLGGLSGSPAYEFDEHGARIVGFVKSGFKRDSGDVHTDEQSVFAGSLLLTHASFLRQDGTLARP